MIWDLFINEKKEKTEEDCFVDTYNNADSTDREKRGLNNPSSLRVQQYLRAKNFLP